MLWIDLLVIRWFLWTKRPARAGAYARRVILSLHAFVIEEGERIAAAARIDVPAKKVTRIIRSSADIYKIGHVLTIDGQKFYVTRLLSAGPKEVLYEAETR